MAKLTQLVLKSNGFNTMAEPKKEKIQNLIGQSLASSIVFLAIVGYGFFMQKIYAEKNFPTLEKKVKQQSTNNLQKTQNPQKPTWFYENNSNNNYLEYLSQ